MSNRWPRVDDVAIWTIGRAEKVHTRSWREGGAVTTHEYVVVDVFADRPLTGNPLAVVTGSDDLDSEQMAAIAAEFNLSETTFVSEPTLDGADWRLRSFTPSGDEVTGAGHNALGAWWWLVQSSRASPPRAAQELGDRVLPVPIDVDDAVTIGLHQGSVELTACRADRRAVLDALAPAQQMDLADTLGLVCGSVGSIHLLVPLASVADVDRASAPAPAARITCDGTGAPGNPDTVPEFPPGFFDRADASADAAFYGPPRLVHHIDDGAIAAVGAYYDEVGVDGDVLDLMSSWVSHLRTRPRHLTVLGMNAAELGANPMADARVVHDLNADPTLPFDDRSFDATVCTVSVDYLTRPVAVCAEVARVLRPGGVFALTFSNRCFPTKAVRGWLETDDRGRAGIVAEYLRRAGFTEPHAERRPSPGDPVVAVRARTPAP